MLDEVFIVIIDEVSIAFVGIGSSQRRYLFMVEDWDSLDFFNGGDVIGTPVKKRRFHFLLGHGGDLHNEGGVIGTRERFHLF